MTLGEVVDASLERFREQPPEAPLVEAQLALTLGRLLARVGQVGEAEELLRRALQILEGEPYPAERANVRLQLAHLLAWSGDPAERRSLLERAGAELDPDDPRVRLTVDYGLAVLARDEGDAERVLPELRAVHERALELLGEEALLTVRIGLARASAEVIHGDREAVAKLRGLLESAAADEQLGGLYASLHARVTLARAHCLAGEHSAARADARVVLDRLKRLGIEPTALNDGLGALEVLGMVASRERDFEAALRWTRQVYDARRERHGVQARKTRRSAASVAAMLFNLGRYDEAEEWIAEHAPASEGGAELDSLDIELLTVRARLLRRSGDDATALRLQDRLIEASARCYGPDRPQTLEARQRRAMTLSVLGRADEALVELEHIERRWAATQGGEHPEALAVAGLRARVLTGRGEVDEACAVLQLRLQRALDAYGPAHGAVTAALFDLGGFANAHDRRAEFFASCEAVEAAFVAARADRPEDEQLRVAHREFRGRMPKPRQR